MENDRRDNYFSQEYEDSNKDLLKLIEMFSSKPDFDEYVDINK